ncbi:MAG: SLBB domain-containing protein [Oligoflexia bacterium]|nr:SLBB domain-containing protein [Oligoflexia bacterium]
METSNTFDDAARTNFIKRVARAGVVGAGGGGLPAYMKFLAASVAAPAIDTVIANGVECEPLLASDKTLMKHWPLKVISGLELSTQMCGARQGILALKRENHDIVDGFARIIEKKHQQKIYSSQFQVKLHLVDSYYPAGDEFILVHDATGRIIAEGQLPLSQGVIVHNVLTLAQLAQIDSGSAIVDRFVTIAGAVKQPKVFIVPIGTPLRELLKRMEMSGPAQNLKIIDGGPMMGKVLERSTVADILNGSSNFFINKRTSGIIILPQDHTLIRMKELSVHDVIRRSKSVCCQCFRCTEFCPRSLLGHSLNPHKTMRSVDYNLSIPTEIITSAFLCSQCGVCDSFACDIMGLSPKKILGEYKKLLLQRGIKNPHHFHPQKTKEGQNFHKVPTHALLKKLDLVGYINAGNVKNSDYEVIDPTLIPKVSISLAEHIGEPAQAIVGVGAMVRLGDLVAISPQMRQWLELERTANATSIGSAYHASISGKVAEVTSQHIVIESCES